MTVNGDCHWVQQLGGGPNYTPRGITQNFWFWVHFSSETTVQWEVYFSLQNKSSHPVCTVFPSSLFIFNLHHAFEVTKNSSFFHSLIPAGIVSHIVALSGQGSLSRTQHNVYGWRCLRIALFTDCLRIAIHTNVNCRSNVECYTVFV